MAEILPLRAWRYHPDLTGSLDELTSPLFDVVTAKQREALYRNKLNSIHLSSPLSDHPAAVAAQTLQDWKQKQILQQDPLPGIYVYYQYFRLPGSDKKYCRKGFICNIKAYDWSERVVLRHEDTMPAQVNDRIELLAQTQLNNSPTHGLYSDPSFSLEPYLDESIASPLYTMEDYQGVTDVLSVIHDHNVIRLFIEKLQHKQVLLADGHHRYEGSLAYRRQMAAQQAVHTGAEGYNYHFMYLTNTEADDFRILATHRLLAQLPLPEKDFLQQLQAYFTVTPKEDPYELNEVILGKPWTFGLYLAGSAYKLRLKPEVHPQLDWNVPHVVKDLDLTVMHYFIFEKILGIPRKEQRTYSGLRYERNFTSCIGQVDTGAASLALITNEVTIEQVKQVCASGALMPQKSTFFYPKVITGFLFSSIKEDEFVSPAAACL